MVREGLIGLSHYLSVPPGASVTDGKPGITGVIKEVFHLKIVQRCLVHVERDLKNYLPLHSPLLATQALRAITIPLTHITTMKERDELYARARIVADRLWTPLKGENHS